MQDTSNWGKSFLFISLLYMVDMVDLHIRSSIPVHSIFSIFHCMILSVSYHLFTHSDVMKYSNLILIIHAQLYSFQVVDNNNPK